MEQSTISEHDCNVLGGFFQIIINDLKNGTATWDDLIIKATKFHAHLKSTILASTAFLDSFQKVADMATTTRGGTKEIGTALTRLCLRQRSVEAKLKTYSSAFLDCLILPLQERIEEWKKSTIQLDKDRTKELKRLRQEFKKRQYCDSLGSSNIRNKKHSTRLNKSKFDFFDSLNSKGIYGTIGGYKSTSSLTRSLDSEMECNERLLMLEDLEKKAVRRALIEERSHFCLFVKFLRPIIEEEVSMIGEISHIQEIMDSLTKLTADPFDLPMSSENVLSHMKLSKNDSLAWNLHTPPSSPSSLGSRKSSLCSISSYNSSSSNKNPANKYYSPSVDITTSLYGSDYFYNTNNNNNFLQCTNYSNNNNNKHQFPIDTQADTTNEKNLIKITSTNPFLNSYNQINNDQCLYDKNPNSATISNSVYLMQNQESDGSITPTNNNNNDQQSKIFADENFRNTGDKIYNKSNKPPPAPPVRRTSSLSNPNAITISALKKVSIDKNDENPCKNSSFYDEINVLTKSMNDINFTLKNTDFTNSSFTKTENENQELKTDQVDNKNNVSDNGKSDYKVAKKIFENLNQTQTNQIKLSEDDGSQLPLPAPPPEAFVDTLIPVASASNIHNHHYNKITNVHREFLETLNSKLSQSPLPYQNNARISKRRSSNQSSPDDYFAYSGKHRSSNRSASTSRISSRKNSIEKNSIASNINETFVEKLSQTLQKQQQNAEMAKAAASTVLQRKQSAPDLNELNSNLKMQNRVTFSSSLNFSSPNQAFQVVNIQTNSTQQPIYSSRTQLRQEIQDLYGSLGNNYSDKSYQNFQNGFFNKL